MDILETRRAILRAFIAERFGGNQTAFARAVGRQPDYISRCLSGKKNLGEELVREFERLLHLPPYYFDGLGARQTLSDGPVYNVPRGNRIPVVGAARLGDNGHFVELEYPAGHGDGYLDIPSNDPNAYALRCEGDSMSPRIKHGEFVIVEPGHAVAPGDEVVVKASDGRVMVKTYLYRREGRVHLLSVNEAHPQVAIDEAQIDAMHYVGAIAKASRWVAE